MKVGDWHLTPADTFWERCHLPLVKLVLTIKNSFPGFSRRCPCWLTVVIVTVSEADLGTAALEMQHLHYFPLANCQKRVVVLWKCHSKRWKVWWYNKLVTHHIISLGVCLDGDSGNVWGQRFTERFGVLSNVNVKAKRCIYCSLENFLTLFCLFGNLKSMLVVLLFLKLGLSTIYCNFHSLLKFHNSTQQRFCFFAFCFQKWLKNQVFYATTTTKNMLVESWRDWIMIRSPVVSHNKWFSYCSV